MQRLLHRLAKGAGDARVELLERARKRGQRLVHMARHGRRQMSCLARHVAQQLLD